MEVSAPSALLAVLGLRALPGATFTSLPAYPTDSSSAAIARQILSHVIDGAEWASIITIVNLDPQPASYQLRIFDSSGAFMPMNLSGTVSSTFAGTIPALSSVTMASPGVAATLADGWAELTSSQRVRAQLMFDEIQPGQPVYEAAVPAIADGQTSLAIPYDNTGGLLTGLALANSGGAQASVQLAVRDETGSVTDNAIITLAAGAKMEFVLTDKAPNSAGKRGLVQLTTQGTPISALGLRFNVPDFTTLPVAAADPAAAPPRQ